MDSFIHFLSEITPLSTEVKTAIKDKLLCFEHPKGHLLIKELNKCDYLYFVEEGLARLFYFKDGKDITDWFAFEGTLIGPVVRNFPQKTGPHSVELLEKSKLTGIHFDDLQELFDTYHEVERIGRVLALQAVLQLQNRLDALQFQTAQQRYENLLKTYPSILQRVSLGHIASFIGITQVSLSRIRGIR